MNKLNNKGQSLVMFVVILPVIIMILMMVVDIGKMVNLKSELDNINYIAISYGLDNISDDDIQDKIRKLIYKNKLGIDEVKIEINDGEVDITLVDGIDLILLKESNILRVRSSYRGIISDEKKIIERNR